MVPVEFLFARRLIETNKCYKNSFIPKISFKCVISVFLLIMADNNEVKLLECDYDKFLTIESLVKKHIS